MFHVYRLLEEPLDFEPDDPELLELDPELEPELEPLELLPLDPDLYDDPELRELPPLEPELLLEPLLYVLRLEEFDLPEYVVPL